MSDSANTILPQDIQKLGDDLIETQKKLNKFAEQNLELKEFNAVLLNQYIDTINALIEMTRKSKQGFDMIMQHVKDLEEKNNENTVDDSGLGSDESNAIPRLTQDSTVESNNPSQ